MSSVRPIPSRLHHCSPRNHRSPSKAHRDGEMPLMLYPQSAKSRTRNTILPYFLKFTYELEWLWDYPTADDSKISEIGGLRSLERVLLLKGQKNETQTFREMIIHQQTGCERGLRGSLSPHTIAPYRIFLSTKTLKLKYTTGGRLKSFAC